MKRNVYLMCLLCLLITPVAVTFGQDSVQVTRVGLDHFESDFPSGGQLRMHIRSGDIRVTGSDDNKIRVHYRGKNADRSPDVTVSLKTTGSAGELRISGGPRDDFEIEIQVPRATNLYLRIPAGEVEVNGVTGDKDVELHAGDLTLGVGNSQDYAQVDASVHAGDLDAYPFAVSKSGLFRSFHKFGPGKYRLRAHVGAGDLTLKS